MKLLSKQLESPGGIRREGHGLGLSQEEYGGVPGIAFVEDYVGFARLCFTLFGGRVNHWTTFNEPDTFLRHGWLDGTFAPGLACASGGVSCQLFYFMQVVIVNILLFSSILFLYSFVSGYLFCNYTV